MHIKLPCLTRITNFNYEQPYDDTALLQQYNLAGPYDDVLTTQGNSQQLPSQEADKCDGLSIRTK